MATPLRFMRGSGRDGRPSMLDVWMTTAHVLARRSTCPRARVGAVLCTPTWELVATGYNGAPSGQAHCDDVGCLEVDGGCARGAHAEVNALLQAAKRGAAVGGSMLVVTHRPCLRCAVALASAGVTRAWWAATTGPGYSQAEAVDRVFVGAGITGSLAAYAAVPPVEAL